MKRSFSLLVSFFVCILLSAIFFTRPAYAADVVESGTCGDNLTWSLNDEGVLTISGIGEMWDYAVPEGYDGPWDEAGTATYSSPFQGAYSSIVISEGVTRIGKNAFCNVCAYEINIPSSIVSISSFPEEMEGIYFSGTYSEWYNLCNKYVSLF